jgi:hypothetical protein
MKFFTAPRTSTNLSLVTHSIGSHSWYKLQTLASKEEMICNEIVFENSHWASPILPIIQKLHWKSHSLGKIF